MPAGGWVWLLNNSPDHGGITTLHPNGVMGISYDFQAKTETAVADPVDPIGVGQMTSGYLMRIEVVHRMGVLGA